MNAGSDINVHADVNVLKLGIDQRVDADSTDARLKRARRDGHPIADLERGLLTIQGADLWVLNDLGGIVVVEKVHCCRWQRDRNVLTRREALDGTQLRRAGSTAAACDRARV